MWGAGRVRHAWKWAIFRGTAPRIGRGAILQSLDACASHAPSQLIVHSSLSACGFTRGGPFSVIQALREWMCDGLLAMPTHSYCYPRPDGSCTVFDRTQTPSVVGTITNEFWRQSGVKRSLHPTHSLACEGSEAEVLIDGHERCDTPCGAGTPYEKLIEQDAAALMFGATMNSYTFFHTAEHAADVPYLYEAQPVTLQVLMSDGTEHVMRMRRQDMQVPRSFAEKRQWLEQRGLLKSVRLGRGELLFIPSSRNVHEVVVAELRRDPSFLTAAQPGRC